MQLNSSSCLVHLCPCIPSPMLFAFVNSPLCIDFDLAAVGRIASKTGQNHRHLKYFKEQENVNCHHLVDCRLCTYPAETFGFKNSASFATNAMKPCQTQRVLHQPFRDFSSRKPRTNVPSGIQERGIGPTTLSLQDITKVILQCFLRFLVHHAEINLHRKQSQPFNKDLTFATPNKFSSTRFAHLYACNKMKLIVQRT